MRLLSTLSSVLAFLFSFPLCAQSGPDLELDTTFYVIPENAKALTPLFAPQFFAVNVQNIGDEAANEVVVSCQITDLTIGEVIYSVEKNYGELLAGESIENDVLNEEAFNLPLTGFLSTRNYRGEYLVTTASNDGNSLNDTITFNFSSGYQRFAKESGRTAGVPLTGSVNYVGNCFYIPQDETLEVRELEFMVDNANELVASEGVLSIYLYETLGDQNEDGLIDSLEYDQVPIYFNEYLFTGQENQMLVRYPIDIDEESIILTGGKYYLLTLVYFGEDEADNLIISVSDAYNYEATSAITAQNGVPQYANISYSSNNLFADRPIFTLNGLGANKSPVIRLIPFFIQNKVEEEELSPDYQVTIFPNPVKDNFTMTFDFPKPVASRIAVFNQEGRLVKSYDPQDIYQTTFRENFHNLPNGIYTLQIITEKGNTSKSIVIQH